MPFVRAQGCQTVPKNFYVGNIAQRTRQHLTFQNLNNEETNKRQTDVTFCFFADFAA